MRRPGGWTHPYRSFSLIELVIVVLIVAVVAAVAVPRMTRGAENADVTALQSNLEALNKAVELYWVEHEGTAPPADDVADHLTRYTDVSGTKIADAPSAPSGVIYGPYLYKIPPMPLGPNEGATGIATAAGPDIGWLYKPSVRRIAPNLLDESGKIPPAIIQKLNLPDDAADDLQAPIGP